MNYIVYIIINIDHNRFPTYVGYTSDLNKRLNLHNKSKGAKFTRGRNWEIIYKAKYSSKTEAMKNEYKLKKNRIKRNKIKLNYLIKNKHI